MAELQKKNYQKSLSLVWQHLTLNLTIWKPHITVLKRPSFSTMFIRTLYTCNTYHSDKSTSSLYLYIYLRLSFHPNASLKDKLLFIPNSQQDYLAVFVVLSSWLPVNCYAAKTSFNETLKLLKSDTSFHYTYNHLKVPDKKTCSLIILKYYFSRFDLNKTQVSSLYEIIYHIAVEKFKHPSINFIYDTR